MSEATPGTPRHLRVAVSHDHLRSLTRCHPSVGVAELVWNALDADAHRIEVWLHEAPLGGVGVVEVRDDGTGIDVTRLDDAFQGLGGSWKATKKYQTVGAFCTGGQAKADFERAASAVGADGARSTELSTGNARFSSLNRY